MDERNSIRMIIIYEEDDESFKPLKVNNLIKGLQIQALTSL